MDVFNWWKKKTKKSSVVRLNEFRNRTVFINEKKYPKNLHLVMIGDSLTRYMYLSLVNYLENGSWNTTVTKQNKNYNIIHEKSFQNWTHFYNFTNNIFNKREICDCFRDEIFKLETLRENRFYQDPLRNNYVSYIQKYGELKSKGMISLEQIASIENPYFNVPYVNFTWEYNWTLLIDEFVSKITPKPSYVVFNAGFWPHDLNEGTLTKIRNVLLENGLVGIYKVTTRTRKNKDTSLADYERIACRLFPCLGLEWTGELPPSLYWDQLHFISSDVYHRMNKQLLDLLEILAL